MEELRDVLAQLLIKRRTRREEREGSANVEGLRLLKGGRPEEEVGHNRVGTQGGGGPSA